MYSFVNGVNLCNRSLTFSPSFSLVHDTLSCTPAMARKSGSKNQGNKHGNGKSKPRGPSSDSQALRTRSLEEVLGVEAIDFGIENEVLTPKSSLHQLQIRS